MRRDAGAAVVSRLDIIAAIWRADIELLTLNAWADLPKGDFYLLEIKP